jgi:hypothetical protein
LSGSIVEDGLNSRRFRKDPKTDYYLILLHGAIEHDRLTLMIPTKHNATVSQIEQTIDLLIVGVQNSVRIAFAVGQASCLSIGQNFRQSLYSRLGVPKESGLSPLNRRKDTAARIIRHSPIAAWGSYRTIYNIRARTIVLD